MNENYLSRADICIYSPLASHYGAIVPKKLEEWKQGQLSMLSAELGQTTTALLEIENIYNSVFGIWDGVVGIWDGVVGIWDTIFGILNGEFGIQDGTFDIWNDLFGILVGIF